MVGFLKLVFNRWVLAVLGLLAIGLLIWWVGPLIAIAQFRPLELEITRVIVITVIVVLILGRMFWRLYKARQANAQLVQGLSKPDATVAPPTDRAGAEEVATLQKRFEEAIAVLKQANRSKSGLAALLPGKQYLYDLPWYVFIGAPGSGKTTALINSGLQFPLVERLGQQKIRGIGGTRNCDWWFSDQAVLLDTAGRYTTQESDEASDKAAWTGFLQLLKKFRPRRPINGAIVTVSVADLLQQSANELEQQAAALRSRIRELHEDLGIRFPVYVLVTKADLLPGFMESFGDYGRDERAQVWGVSFPLAEKNAAQLPGLGDELAALEDRLNARVVDLLQRERDLQSRALIYTFPQQFAALKVVLGDFLAQVFEPTRFETQPMVRGVYFTSGTQEGSPIDRIMGQLARSLHLEERMVAPNQPSGKSYFITRLINEIMLPEAGLAGTNLRWERQRTAMQLILLTLAGLVTIGAIVAWTISYSRNQAYVAEVAASLQKVSKQVAELQAKPTPDVVGLLPALQAVRGLAAASNAADGDVPWSMGFGLYQGDKLGAASRAAYRRLLQDAFLPRLQARLEEQLRTGGKQDPELLYEGLKAYVMLSDPAHFDADAIKAFIVLDWDTNLAREVTREQRKDLASHLDALFEQGAIASPILADVQLVSGARDVLARTPIAQRIYNRLRRSGVGATLPEFTIAGAAGPTAPLVFVRESGQPLTKGVPGLFSYDGYYNTFLPAADKVSAQFADEESWVLGLGTKTATRIPDPRVREGIVVDVRRIYLQEYARIWEDFVNDVKVIHAGTLSQSIDSAKVLSAADSPLPTLLFAIVNEVTLVRPKDEQPKRMIDKATDQLSQLRQKGDELKKFLADLGTQPASAPGAAPLEMIVDARFESLRRMVRPPAPGQPAPVNGTVALIAELYTLLLAIDAAQKNHMPPPASELPTRITAESGRLPEPLRSVLTILLQDGVNRSSGAARDSINQALAPLSLFCLNATKGRYPFVKTSALDVTQEDFKGLFGPGGRFDEFFKVSLSPYVDTTTQPWQFRQIGDPVTRPPSTGLAQFQRAQTIRDVFFRGGNPSLRLEFKPVEMDTTITQFILDVDGQLVSYNHGPQVPVTVQWPGPKGSMQVRLELSPPSAGGASGQVYEGPWAFFRMLDATKMEPTSQPEKFILTFDVGGRKARFQVLTASVENPFRLDALSQFQCPEQL